jgi:thioredoxin 1
MVGFLSVLARALSRTSLPSINSLISPSIEHIAATMQYIAALLLCSLFSCVLAFLPRPLHLPSFRTSLAAIGDIKSQRELDDVTIRGGSSPVIIDFQKSACKPCIRIAPQFLEMSEKYSQVQFYKVDADSSREALDLLKGNNVRSVPTFQLWRCGKKIDDVRGAHLDDVTYLIEDELKKMGA